MKRMLGVLAAGILAVAPVTTVMAEEHHPAVEAPADTAVVSHEYKLNDGTVIHVEGDMAYTVNDEGTKTPLADGEYTLEEGAVVEVMEGKISGIPAPEAPAMAPSDE